MGSGRSKQARDASYFQQARMSAKEITGLGGEKVRSTHALADQRAVPVRHSSADPVQARARNLTLGESPIRLAPVVARVQ